MRRASAPTLALLGVLSLGTVLWSAASAQQISGRTGRERITLTAGEILEIIAISDITDARMGWVLTKERRFIEASRDPVFRTRIIDPGLYLLDASVATPDESTQQRRTIDLDVKPVGEAPAQPEGIQMDTLVETDPPLVGERLLLSEGQQIVKMWRTRENIQALDLDLDTTEDSNGDGNLGNDIDTAQTFFRTNGGFPLHLWFVSEHPQRTVQLTATLEDGAVLTQRIEVLQGERVMRPYEITPVPRDRGVVEFSVLFQEPVPEAPLLFHWDFGDGVQSLLDRPVHTYAKNGTYPVLVRVRDLITGNAILELQREIAVENAGGAEPSPTAGGEITEQPKEQVRPKGSFLGLMFRLVLVLGFSLGLGVLGMFAWKRLRPKAPKLPAVESEGTKGVATKEATEAPKPMELKRGAKEPAEKTKEPPKAQPSAPQPKLPPPPPTKAQEPPKSSEPPEPETMTQVPPWLAKAGPPAENETMKQSDESDPIAFIRAEGIEEENEKQKEPEKNEDAGQTKT